MELQTDHLDQHFQSSVNLTFSHNLSDFKILSTDTSCNDLDVYSDATWPSLRFRLGSVGLCWDLLALHLQSHELPWAPTDFRLSKHWFFLCLYCARQHDRSHQLCELNLPPAPWTHTFRTLHRLHDPYAPEPSVLLLVPFQLTCPLFKPGTHG